MRVARCAPGGQLCLVATSRAWCADRAALSQPRRRLPAAHCRLHLAAASSHAEDGAKHGHGDGVKRGLAFQVLSGAYVLLAASASVAGGGDGRVALAVPALVQATAAHALSDASKHHRLGSDTYQRLTSGLLLSSAATLAVAAASRTATTAVPALVAACAAAACVAAYRGKLRPLAGAPVLWSVTTFRGLAARTYASFATTSAAVAAALLFVPAWVLSSCGLAVTVGRVELTRILGAALVSHAVTLYVLADAADRSRLGGTTFKHLNCACAAAATLGGALLVMAANAASGDGVTVMALALLQIVPASVCLFQYLTGVKVKTLKT